MSQNAYQQGLDKNAANYVPLSPLSFIERTAMVYPTRTSVVHGTLAYTWSQTYERCRRLASALVAHGVKKGDTAFVEFINTTLTDGGDIWTAIFDKNLGKAGVKGTQPKVDPVG